jgi:SAM-dependent methyltransferase
MDGKVSSSRKSDSFLRLPRQKILAALPHWLRDRLDLHHTRINELVSRASRSAKRGQRLLDAGAGECRYKQHFKHLAYTGIDLAVGDVNWDYTSVDVIGDLSRLPMADNVFDLALCLEVLEHVREPRQILTEIQRALKPGGKLYISVPFSWHQHQKPYDYYRYTSFGLRYLLEATGFEVEELQPTGGYFWFLSIQFQFLSLWIFPLQQTKLQRVLLLPVKVIVQAIFFVLLPLLCFYLDRLDRQKDQTLAWTAIGVKRQTL